MTPDGERIKGLDGVRAGAFLMVLCGHCGLKWIPNGFGVTVFFFLSGYLITTLLRREWMRTGEVSVTRFYIRRAFRILPPLYCAIALGVGAALCGILNTPLQWRAILAIQFFLTNYAEQVPGLTIPLGLSPLWSLAVEEHFYLLFPVVYVLLLKSRMSPARQAMWLGGACALALSWRYVMMGPLHSTWNRVYIGTDTRLDSILFGVILAIVANPAMDSFPRLTRKHCAYAALAGTTILLASIAARGEFFRQTARYSIQGLALTPVFFYIVRYPSSLLTRILEMRFLTTIGDLSYAMYVFHYIVMFAVNTWVTQNPAVTLLLTLSMTLALAMLSRQFVERPASRLRNKVLLRTRTDRNAEAASPTLLPHSSHAPVPRELSS